MKKTFAKVLSVMLALMLLVSAVAVLPAAAAENEYTAALGYTDSSWSSQTGFGADSSVQTTVSGDGTYTLSWDASAADALVFVIDIVGGGEALSGSALTDMTISVDGNDVPVNVAKVLTGDIEGNGNWRMEIYNEYGAGTKENPPIDPAAISFGSNLTVTFTLGEAGAAPAADEEPVEETEAPVETEAEEPAAEVAPFDANGTYNAYLLLQTPNWTYRDAWNSANGVGSEYWGSFIYGNETSEKYGVVTDAVVAGNGTYTISLTDFGTIISDDFTTASQDYFNVLGISTDIPLTDDVQITDVKLIIDGQTRHTYKEAYLDPDETAYVKVLIQNIWNEDVKEISYYPAPTSSVEIQFTVSGFAYDAEQPAEETEPVAVEAPAAEESGSSATGIIIAVVVIAAVVVVAVVVMKKKKAA